MKMPTIDRALLMAVKEEIDDVLHTQEPFDQLHILSELFFDRIIKNMRETQPTISVTPMTVIFHIKVFLEAFEQDDETRNLFDWTTRAGTIRETPDGGSDVSGSAA